MNEKQEFLRRTLALLRWEPDKIRTTFEDKDGQPLDTYAGQEGGEGPLEALEPGREQD